MGPFSTNIHRRVTDAAQSQSALETTTSAAVPIQVKCRAIFRAGGG
jgi:hypothetical protein